MRPLPANGCGTSVALLPVMGVAIQSTFDRLTQTRRHHGLPASLHWFAARLGEKLFRLEVADLLWLDGSKMPPTISIDPAFTFRFLTAAEIKRYSADPIYELAPDCVRRATSSHHFCFAVLDGQRLASYSWYAPGAIEAEHNVGVAMSFPANAAYMYKAFTHPDYRGRRLYGAGMALALKALEERGITKLVTTVHTNNFASLASCRRLGYEQIGRIWTLGRGHRRWAIKPQTAKKFGIQFCPPG